MAYLLLGEKLRDPEAALGNVTTTASSWDVPNVMEAKRRDLHIQESLVPKADLGGLIVLYLWIN